jgi:hypothetical protein
MLHARALRHAVGVNEAGEAQNVQNQERLIRQAGRGHEVLPERYVNLMSHLMDGALIWQALSGS